MDEGEGIIQCGDTEARRIERVREEFFASIGKCITFWAGIEAAIFTLFCSIVADDKDIAAYIFWNFPTFKMRLSYTSGVTAIFLKKRNQENLARAWIDIVNRISKSYTFRNKLAHQPIDDIDLFYTLKKDGKTTVWGKANDNLQILPNRDDPKQKFSPIDRVALENHYKEIQLVDFDLNSFTGHIWAMLEVERRDKDAS